MADGYDPPNTPLTATLRSLWSAAPSGLSFKDWYLKQCQRDNPTTNGRALAAIAFDRANTYWPDFHRPTDTYAVGVWAELIDEVIPTATPDMIVSAVDSIAESGKTMQIAYLLSAVKAQ